VLDTWMNLNVTTLACAGRRTRAMNELSADGLECDTRESFLSSFEAIVGLEEEFKAITPNDDDNSSNCFTIFDTSKLFFFVF
jgi:hypothetical protein